MSWQNTLLTLVLRRRVKPNARLARNIAVSRAMMRWMPVRGTVAPGWRIRAADGPPLEGEWIEPVAASHPARGRSILHLHGGGYVTMAARNSRSITTRLAVWSGARLFALNYRLAPEHRFPAALEDAVAAYRALLGAGVAPDCIVVAGESAGGGLALALLVALRDAGERLPAAAVLFSPWTDLAATGQSIVANSDADALIDGSWVAPMGRHYLGDAPATDPRASPVYADLRGLPPMLVQVSDTEVLLDDARRIVGHARRAGVDARLSVWAGLPHVWQFFTPILPEGRAALREAAAYVRAMLGR